MIIAIQPDDYTHSSAAPMSDAASTRWTHFIEKAGHRVRAVNVHRADILEQLRGCDGFMWRWAHFDGMKRIAHRLLPVVERHLNLPVYPDQATCWHYDDKIAQTYLFQALGIPTPQTWIWFNLEETLDWLREYACFPLVLKLAGGAGSNNVRLLRTQEEAIVWTKRLFRYYRTSLKPIWGESPKEFFRHIKRMALYQEIPGLFDNGYDPQAGYALFQEFLPDNDFDSRITVIGNRAFGFRRFNRPDDFRASGSGRLDYTPRSVDEAMIRLGFRTARALNMQSCAIDGLYRHGIPLVGEVSYTYVSHSVFQCPGHWELNGSPENGVLRWIDGQSWPEEAQAIDFLEKCQGRNLL